MGVTLCQRKLGKTIKLPLFLISLQEVILGLSLLPKSNSKFPPVYSWESERTAMQLNFLILPLYSGKES